MNTTGLNQFFKYGDINDSFMRVTRRSIESIEYNPYHINEQDLDYYLNCDGGGDDLVEIFKHDKYRTDFEYYKELAGKYGLSEK